MRAYMEVLTACRRFNSHSPFRDVARLHTSFVDSRTWVAACGTLNTALKTGRQYIKAERHLLSPSIHEIYDQHNPV